MQILGIIIPFGAGVRSKSADPRLTTENDKVTINGFNVNHIY